MFFKSLTCIALGRLQFLLSSVSLVFTPGQPSSGGFPYFATRILIIVPVGHVSETVSSLQTARGISFNVSNKRPVEEKLLFYLNDFIYLNVTQ